jgi:tetratricopeptide (TPR) repeat protein
MRFRVIFFGLIGAAVAGVAQAQTSPDVSPKSVVAPAADVDINEVQIQRRILFQHMLAKPDDLDAAFEYAALSIKAGDLEAAISTLERMLIFAPGLPRLQLELGVLYYRLAAYDTARSYFQAAISGPDVPDQVRSKVDEYLAAIEDGQDTTRFHGQVRAGYRYQTNANRSPVGSTVVLNGLPFTLSEASLGSPDSNVYGAGVFHYSIDLPSQGNTIEVDLVTYASKQFERDDLNLALAELTIGPAFDLNSLGMENAVLGVYGIASTVFINGHFYSVGYGAGARFVTQPSPSFTSTTAIEYRQRDYHNSAVAPLADDRDGGEIRGYSSATYIVNPRLALTGLAYAQYDKANKGYLTYSEAGFSAGPIIAFDAPIGHGEPWVLSPSAGLVWRQYEDPDPMINALDAEHDFEAFVGANLTVPIRNGWALLTETEFRTVNSNYGIREYDNFSAAISLVKGF